MHLFKNLKLRMLGAAGPLWCLDVLMFLTRDSLPLPVTSKSINLILCHLFRWFRAFSLWIILSVSEHTFEIVFLMILIFSWLFLCPFYIKCVDLECFYFLRCYLNSNECLLYFLNLSDLGCVIRVYLVWHSQYLVVVSACVATLS